MGNAKISDTNVFVDTITDIKDIDGFAAYSTSSPTGNAAMSGNAIIDSLEANLDLTDFTQFTGSAGQVLTINGSANGLTWSTIPSATTPDIADVLTEGDTSNAGQKIAFVDSTFTGNTRLQASGLISSYGGNFTIQHTQGGTLRIENFNEAGTDPIILDANDGYIRMQSSVQLLTNDILDSNTSSGTAGQVLSSKGSGSGTEWITPTSGVSSFTSLTPGDVVKWDYSVDGPNIELITTQDPDPAITRDNVITMWDDSTDTASSISSIPDGATGILIVHPTANPYFNFPTGSKISDGSNIRLDGSTKVLRWVKEGDGNDPTAALGSQGYGCLYWAGFENFTTPATILGPDIAPAIISNLYGWWDPDDYTGAVLGDQNDPATGSPYLGVVNNSTLTSKSLGGSSTGNSLTVDNEETQADEAWEHIEWVNLGSSNYSFDFKPTGSANFLFNNDTVNPTNNRYTVMVWFRSDFSSDNSDLGLFNASITGSSSQLNLSSGIKADNATSTSSRNISYTTRNSSFGDIKEYQSKYQNWANNDWTCLIMAFDPVKDDGAGGTYAEIRHLMGNEYTEEKAGDTITGSGIVSDSDEIDINANGTYIDFLYDDGDLSKPSDGSAAGVPASEKLVASEMIEQFTGFQFARTAAPYYSTHDWNGEIGLCCLWDGEAKSDADMQTIYDYSKSKFGL